MKHFLLVPLTTTLAVSMLKAVMLEAALINTIPISVILGTTEDANPMFISLIIDPLL